MIQHIAVLGDEQDSPFDSLGYEYVSSHAAEAGGLDMAGPILPNRFGAALQRLNPWLDRTTIRQVVQTLRGASTVTQIQANENAHRLLVAGMQLTGGVSPARVRFIDFDDVDANDFAFTRRYRTDKTTGAAITDTVIFVNGIALAVIEHRADGGAASVDTTIASLQRAHGSLAWSVRLSTIQLLVAACGSSVRYGTVGTPARLFSEWRSAECTRQGQGTDLEDWGFLTPATLLELTRDFVLFEGEGSRREKKVARRAQYDAVIRVLAHIRRARQPAARSGIVWHAEGAGKSLVLLFLAAKLRRHVENVGGALIVVSERGQVDDRVAEALVQRGHVSPVRLDTAEGFRAFLSQGHGRAAVVSAVQFQKAITARRPIASGFTDVFVIVDEGFRCRQRRMPLVVRQALPDACLLGVTGSPIETKGRFVFESMGPYIDRYPVERALCDRARVPVHYEAREVAESAAPDRTLRVCRDLILHFEQHVRPNGMKARLIVRNRAAAKVFKSTLDVLGGPEAAVAISTCSETERRSERARHEHQRLLRRFRDPLDPLVLLIVCDPSLTSSDSSVEQVVYLDAPLRQTWLTAIARVSRVAPGKSHGVIVDYSGDVRGLKRALDDFQAEDVRGVLSFDPCPRAPVAPALAAPVRVVASAPDAKVRSRDLTFSQSSQL